jgi:hypothetical protein
MLKILTLVHWARVSVAKNKSSFTSRPAGEQLSQQIILATKKQIHLFMHTWPELVY